MIELLLSLMIVCFSVMLITSALALIPEMIKSDNTMQDEIALSQIRHIALLSKDFEVSFDSLTMCYLNETIILYQDDHRLVKADGYQILMQNLKEVEFIQKGNCIYMLYTKVGEEDEKQRFITCE